MGREAFSSAIKTSADIKETAKESGPEKFGEMLEKWRTTSRAAERFLLDPGTPH
jgi:hypothetical protein